MAKKKRLLWQLYPSYLLIILISLIGVLWYGTTSLQKFYSAQVTLDLKDRAYLLERQITVYLAPRDAGRLDSFCKEIGAVSSTRITVILASGKVIGDSAEDPKMMETHLDRPEVMEALRGQVGISTRFSRTLQKNMMYVGIPLKKGSDIIGVVRTSLPLTSVDEAIKAIQIKIAIGGLIAAVFAAAISLLVSRRISRPIEQIKKGAECFARGEFECRLPISNLEEIGGLSETMNEMAARLQEQINTIMRQRGELEAVLSSMMEGVVAVDREERIISMNQAAADMFETNRSRVQGRGIQEIVRNVDFQRFLTSALSSEEPVEEDIVLYSEGERILNLHSTTLQDEGARRIGALIVVNDVTRLRRLENVRRDFVANVSHEIKTPLTAIKGFVETLRDGAMKDPEDAGRFLEIILKHVNRLDAIIEDLLNLSRIEQDAEKNAIALQDGRLNDVLLTAIQLCEVKAASKNIHIALSCKQDLKAKINSPLLEQAVVNLLDNAIKYSDAESTIRVEARKTDDQIILSVRDEGCGIGKEHLDRLFERFYRIDRARSRKLGGTGLGLAIVKHITQAHGGHISVESTPGKGSTFSLHLPSIS